MKTVTINLYSFDELTEQAQEKAIQDHAEFLAQEEEEEFSRDDVIDNIIINNYLFFEDGELAHITEYTGKHPKSGTLEFHFHGRTFDITNL